MKSDLQFETPENIQIHYQIAGLGTRFVAWFLDMLVVSLLMFIALILLLILGGTLASTIGDAIESLFDNKRAEQHPEELIMVLFGVMAMVWGFGSFFYYTLFELLMRGQTPGKKSLKIRVIKLDGFSLDPGSVVLRNIFRVVDHMPPMWAIPFLSERTQRAGDLVAGTVVIADSQEDLTAVRTALSGRSAADAEFRFDHGQLSRLLPSDYETVERLLDRWYELPETQRSELCRKISVSLARKLNCDPPVADRRVRFLEDLFAAELRRQDRTLL